MVLVAGAFVVMHILIFAVSGIAFWKWVVADVAFLGIVLHMDSQISGTVFTKRTVVVVTVLILLSTALVQMSALAWYSMNYQERHSVEMVSVDGEVHEMHWSDMDPFALTIRTGRFGYIDEEPGLSRGTFG